MRDVTPQGEIWLITKSLAAAVGIVALIAFFKIAFDAFVSVSYLIIPVAVAVYLLQKINGNK